MIRAWFSHLSGFLIKYRIKSSKLDHSLFTYCANNVNIYLLVYVKDIIITGGDSCMVTNVITTLEAEFVIRDLG